jgi:hypothetical protein
MLLKLLEMLLQIYHITWCHLYVIWTVHHVMYLHLSINTCALCMMLRPSRPQSSSRTAW